jgi:pimeloyl-ACP methyl ester carboxylesterase
MKVLNLIRRIGIFIALIMTAWLIYAQFGMQFRKPDALATAQFQKAGVKLVIRTDSILGFKLHYVITGADSLPTLLFVHGSPGGWIRFEKYLRDKDLLHKFRMVSIDRPGYGYSEYGHIVSLQRQSDIISALVRRLENNKPWYAAGRSYGGPLITKLAIDNPGRFSGLVLIAAALDPGAEKPEKWRPVMMSFPLKYLLPGAWRQANRELWQLKKELPGLSDHLSEISCPVIVLHGDKDGLVPVSNAAYIKQKFTGAQSVEVTIIPGANHFVSDHHYELVKSKLMNLGN